MKLLYFFDPYCGWCYGFAPVLHAFVESVEHMHCEYITGGMIMGEREGLVSPQMAKYIVDAQPRLREYTGAVVGEAFIQKMKNAEMYFSSIKPSLAVQTAKTIIPDQVQQFTYAMQQKHFIDGDDLQSDETYIQLAIAFNANPTNWVETMNSEECRLRMSRDFMFTSNCGISGFPALVLQHKEQYFLLGRGYAPLEQLHKTYDSVMAEIGSH